MTRFVAEDLGRALIPDDHRAAAARKPGHEVQVDVKFIAPLASSSWKMAPFLWAADAVALMGDLADYRARTNREALAPGSQGWWDDSYGLIRPWGFDVTDISVPVLLLHGKQDKFVPFAHGQWLAAHIPGVEARLLEDDGHLTLQTHRIREVHSWLRQRL